MPDFDLFTYSFPCQAISSAGLQKGLTEGSGTTSSLLWECRKAIEAKRPKYLLMENVSALLSDKFKPQFAKWCKELEEFGYTNFYQLMNAKDYGVPQNRLRIFMVSILGDHAPYYFPKPFKLERRLKDVLETDVDERYYLSDERVQKLLESTQIHKERGNGFAFKPHSEDDIASTIQVGGKGGKTDNYIAEPSINVIGSLNPDNKWHGDVIRQQDMVVSEDGISPTIPSSHSKHEFKVATCATRTRSYKGQPETLEIGGEDAANTITSVAKDSMVVESHRQANIKAKLMPNGDIRCYDASTPDKRGISELQFTNPDNEAPTVTTQGQIKVIEQSIITPPHGYFAGAVNTETAPTVKCSAMQAQNFVIEQQVLGWVRDEKGNVVSRPEVEVANCVTAGKRDNTQNYVKETTIIQKVGDRSNPTLSEKNIAFTVNANPMSDRQQFVKEQVILTTQRTEEAKELRRQGIETFAHREYTERKDGLSGTLTTVAKDNFVKEEVKIVKVGQLDGYESTGRVYAASGISPTINTCQGGGHEPKIIEDFYANREPRMYEGECPTIRSERTGLMCTHGLRVRRLTERELFRLQDVDEADIDTLLSAGIPRTQLAKLAGNSIVVNCLYYIFRNLFIEDTVEDGQQLTLF